MSTQPCGGFSPPHTHIHPASRSQWSVKGPPHLPRKGPCGMVDAKERSSIRDDTKIRSNLTYRFICSCQSYIPFLRRDNFPSTPVCVDNECVECVNNSNCRSNPSASFCDRETLKCAPCRADKREKNKVNLFFFETPHEVRVWKWYCLQMDLSEN